MSYQSRKERIGYDGSWIALMWSKVKITLNCYSYLILSLPLRIPVFSCILECLCLYPHLS